ncbi:MAG: shikimate kinase, partial [Thermoproteota archaeon]|nr:shikimate kinase [Thermoproteota archaeon]
MKVIVRSTMHGAISIVNAIATGKGSALGISLNVTAEVKVSEGQGIKFPCNKADKLINNILHYTIPEDIIDNNSISVKICSNIPSGWGLKSSSAVSNALALACTKIATDEIDDKTVLESAVRASRDANVTVTGAYDDSTACYFGGFVITDNYLCKLIRRERAQDGLVAIIFLPYLNQRANIYKLPTLSDLFLDAFKIAERGNYWKAMKMNGVLTSAAFSANYEPILSAIENGALSASISGNGPSIAAICYKDNVESIKAAFSKFKGNIL